MKADLIRDLVLALRKSRQLLKPPFWKLSKPDGHRVLSFLAVILLAIVATIPIPVNASVVDVQTTPFYIKDAGSYYEVNNGQLITYLYKASDGYNTYYDLSYQPLVYSERFTLEYLQGANWKQRGIPISVDFKATETAILVTRHYDDWLGTTFDVVYNFTPNNPIKITINIKNGQSSTYRLTWTPSGITKTAYTTQANGMTFDNLAFDWSDVYYSLGDITATSISNVAQGKKLDMTFNIGYLAAGKSLTIDPSIVLNLGSTSTGVGVGECWQRKAWYAAGRHWVWYRDQVSYVRYRTSTDGVTWSGDTTIKTGVSLDSDFSTWYDGTYCYYILRVGTTLYFRRGTPQTNGTITWSAAEQTGISTTAAHPFVSADSGGYPWIGYRDSVSNCTYVTKSSTNDGTWSTDAGFPYLLTATTSAIWRTSIIPMTSSRMVAVYGYQNDYIHIQAWNGTAWQAAVNTTSQFGMTNGFSQAVLGEYAYIGFIKITNYHLMIDKYSYASNSIVSETDILTASSNGGVLLVVDGTTGLYCWYPDRSNEHMYYKRYNGTSWDASWTDWYTDPYGIQNGYISTASYQNYGGIISLAWLTGSYGGYYYLRYGHLVGEPTVVTNAATDVSYTTATLNGNITVTPGGINATMRGFQWGTSTGNYSWSWNETGSFGTGAFSHGINSLSVNTTYYFRAFATNDGGTGYGSELNFTTLLPLPLAPTNFTATQTGVSSINLTWAMGLYATDVYIMGKEGQPPSDMTDGYLVYFGNGTYVELTGLSLGLNTYYYKAWSSNPTGNSTDYAETNIGGDSMMFLVFAIIPLALLGFWVVRRNGFLAYAASGAFVLLALMSMQQSSAPNPGTITDVYMGLFWIGIGMTVTCALLPTLTREKVVKEDIEGEWENEDMSAFGEGYESKVKVLTPEQRYRRRIAREARTGIVRT